MRLINTETLSFEEHQDGSVDYAILSHRWEGEEIQYQDWSRFDHIRNKRTSNVIEEFLKTSSKRKGFDKLLRFCNLSRDRGHKYAWIDTCCIDKKSSAELSEAINSMFQWYARAAECYAYLSDYDSSTLPQSDSMDSRSNSMVIDSDDIPSQWFRRGWTLQELLAPHAVLFFDKEWRLFGTKETLSERISKTSLIPQDALLGRQVQAFTIAERMSWASGRVTTRIEDRAYSLMGLFNVNMPMLYGEGEKAFLRLQTEIIKYSNDHSIFAWTGVPEDGSGPLASSPDNFVKPNSDVKWPDPHAEPLISLVGWGRTKEAPEEPFSFTNLGLSISLEITPWAASTYLGLIERQITSWTGIFLKRKRNGQYRRIRQPSSGSNRNAPDIISGEAFELSRDNRLIVRRRLNVQQDGLVSSLSVSQMPWEAALYGFKIQTNSINILEQYVSTNGIWNRLPNIVEIEPGQSGAMAVIDLSAIHKRLLSIKVGIDADFCPRCIIIGRNDTGNNRFLSAGDFGGHPRLQTSIQWSSKWRLQDRYSDPSWNIVSRAAVTIRFVEPLRTSSDESSEVWAIHLDADETRTGATFYLVESIPVKDPFPEKNTLQLSRSQVGAKVSHVLALSIVPISYNNRSCWKISFSIDD